MLRSNVRRCASVASATSAPPFDMALKGCVSWPSALALAASCSGIVVYCQSLSIGNISGQIDNINGKMDNMNQRLNGRIDNLHEKMNVLSDKFDGLKEEIRAGFASKHSPSK